MVGERVGPYWKPESHSYTGALHSTTTQGHAGREEPPKLCRHPLRDSAVGVELGSRGGKKQKKSRFRAFAKTAVILPNGVARSRENYAEAKTPRMGIKLKASYIPIDA